MDIRFLSLICLYLIQPYLSQPYKPISQFKMVLKILYRAINKVKMIKNKNIKNRQILKLKQSSLLSIIIKKANSFNYNLCNCLYITNFIKQQNSAINIELSLQSYQIHITNQILIRAEHKQKINSQNMKTTVNSNHTKMQNQTMYNLHEKRTLPRDVIRWMQGLDLSYSVKDYRKDMSNGFLIAQIISRYEPGKIPMHAFQNSQNQARKDNNWTQLQLFFSKNTLRSIQISSDQYSKIKNSLDAKSEHLYNFVCRLYSICTKRTIPQNAPVLDLPPTQNNNPNLTTSYLLRDEGLEKLDNSGIQSNNGSQLVNSGYTEKNKERVPTRKIAANIQTGDLVDATGVGIKTEGRKMTSKKKSWNFNQKQQSNQQDEDAQKDKLIFDYLISIVDQCLRDEDPGLRQLLYPDNSKFSPTQIIARNVQTIDQKFLRNVVAQFTLSCEGLAPIVLREINQTWKFFTYFFRFLRNLNENSPLFEMVCQLVSSYAKECHKKEPKRLSKILYDSLLASLISQAKLAGSIRKKYKIMQLVYDFSGRELEQKKGVLAKLKDEIGSSNVLYIQWLSVLVKEEVAKDRLDSRLLDDYLYYALQYISSSSVVSKTSALKIIIEISKTHPALIQKFFVSKIPVFRNVRGDPEQVYLFIEIYFNILRDLVESKQYQSLVKGVGGNNLVKAYNPDNEKNAQQLKAKVNSISETIKLLNQGSANESVRQICSRKSVLYIQQSKHMMRIFLDYIYSLDYFDSFFSSQLYPHEFKSFTVEENPISIGAIKDYSNEILIEIISLKTNSGYVIEEFIQLINTCLQNLNVKKINMEFWEDVSLHVVKPYTKMLTQVDFTKAAVQGLTKVFNIYFNYDMKIRELSQWIAESVNTYKQQCQDEASNDGERQTQIVYINQSILQLNEWLNKEYQRNKNQMISFVINQISQNLIERETPGQNNSKLIFLRH